MANNKSAQKRIRQNEAARLRNRSPRSAVRTSIRHFQADVKSKDKAAAQLSFQQMVKLMDTAARKGVIHPKAAARKKSRMHKLLHAVTAA